MSRLALLAVPAAVTLAAACFSARGGAKRPSCPQDVSVELGLQEDVNRLAGCEVLRGIVIRSGAQLELSPLRELEEVTGDISIGPTIGLDEVAFNGLVKVGGTIRVATNNSLRGLFFPRLERAGRIEIENNVALATISVPRLTEVQGALVIADNAGLELISAPVLHAVRNELVIAGHTRLELVEMSKLTTVAAVRVEGNPKLAPEIVENLTRKSALDSAPAR